MMITKRIKMFIAVVSLVFFAVSPVIASSLRPSILDIQIDADVEQSGILEYINTSDSISYLRPLILAYDAKEELVIEDGYVFVHTKDILYEVEPRGSVEIPYSISFEHDVIDGTYFNVLAMISQPATENAGEFELDEAQFNINIGEGALFASHVKENGEINIFQEIEITLIPSREWFIPYLLPVHATLTIENTSNFVLDLGGELKAIKESGEVLNVSRNGSEFTKLYPGDALEMVSEATLNSFGNISFVYTLGENISNQQQTDIVLVQNYSLYIVVSVGITVTLILLFILKRKKKKLA